MYHDQNLQKSVAANNNLHQVILSEVKKEQVKTHESTIPDIAIYLSPIGFISGWLIFLVILRKVRAYLDEKMVFPSKSLHKLPCKNCQFYSNNNYLKCAVNPSIVLTEEAMNCSEYSSNNKKLPSKNPLD
ncbi:MAG: hypothetical protein V7L01_33360 [Nostoc sp.]|uniref:hypothetical protein n=1 Tax=Nostoc sp. TaxID=1180 RepID=UPI002FF8AE72